MSDESLRQGVEEFRTAMEGLSLSEDNRRKLTELLEALETKLETPHDPAHPHSLVEHLKDSYNRYKAEHADATPTRPSRGSPRLGCRPRAPRLGSPPQRAGVTQLVECQLPKLNVEGSSPFARSM